MKWYSVKKFKPALNSKVFAITENGDIWTATYCYDDKFTDGDGEEVVFVSDTDCITLNAVTHFCIPDPIELEE